MTRICILHPLRHRNIVCAEPLCVCFDGGGCSKRMCVRLPRDYAFQLRHVRVCANTEHGTRTEHTHTHESAAMMCRGALTQKTEPFGWRQTKYSETKRAGVG